MPARRRSSNHRGVSIIQSKEDVINNDMCNSHQSSICKVLGISIFPNLNVLMKPQGGPGMPCKSPQNYAWTDVVLDKGYQVCLANWLLKIF